MNPTSQTAQLLLGLVAIARGAAAIQLGGRLLEERNRAIAVTKMP